MKLLSFLVIAALAVSVSVAIENQQKLKEYHDDCLEETDVDDDLTNPMQEGRFADEPKLKEYIFCFNKKIKFQNDKGEFQLDPIREMLSTTHSDAVVEKVIRTCTEDKDTPQEAAFESLKSEDEGRRMIQQCLEENGLENSDMETFFGGDTSKSISVKKVFFCMAKRSGYVNDDGDLLPDGIKLDLRFRKNFSEEEADKIVKKCAVKKDTPPETAFSLIKCLVV